MTDDNIPPGADHYWGADLDLPDTRDEPPEDDHQITDEQAEAWAAEMGEVRDIEDVLAELAEIYGVPV
jgi:hypothetical protein